MKFKNNHVGFLLAGLITILLKCALLAQVNTNLEFRAETPHTSYAQVCHSNTCNQGYSSDRDEGEALTDKIKATFPVAVSSKGNVSIDADIISGIITCGDVNCAGDGSYRREIYVDAVPEIGVRVRFQSTSQTTGTGWAKFTYSGTEHTLTNGTSQWSEVVKPSTYKTILVGEKTYYWLGSLVLQAGAGGGAGSNGGVSAQISNIRANYIGNVLSIDTDGGNNQTWVTRKQFPKPLRVKVLDNETGTPVSNKGITFQILWPEAPGDYVPAVYPTFLGGANWFYTGFTGPNGMVAATLINGSMPYGSTSKTYYVKATCDSCIAGQREVTFTETAVTPESVTELSVVQCESYAAINTPVRNSFVVRAFNTLTHEGEPNWTINFNKEVFPAGSEGQKILPSSTLTNPQGIAFSSMWTGDKVGGYTYRAVCPSCLLNPQVWCSVLAAQPPKVEARPLDDGPEAGDPGVTPMLRISNIYYPNDGVSFTTHDAENTITTEAELRPTTPEYAALKGSIAWEVKDSPRDAPDMNSGDPDDPAPGESTAFEVTAPPAPTGRQLPLKYMIQAKVMTPKGLVKSYPRHIKQDNIDKCRQEYIDYIDAGKALNLSEVPRSRFTPGVDSEFLEEKDRGDCHAYIYPLARAMEVFSLRALHQGVFGIKVKSGYRSPRVNYRTTGASSKSRHMYGDAVDIVPTPKTNTTKNILWPTVGAPKMLEKSVDPNILLKYRTSGEILTIRNSDFSGKYDPKDTNGDGFTDTIQDGDTILQIKNMSWVTLKKYLADSNGDGIPNIIERTEWMHLGE